MKRNIDNLAGRAFDLIVIGGGIYGSCVAWEAALRGLSVALVEQGDFGHATSANSQKIVHGGFRYLQHADLTRMRESIRERKILMRIAPHLVHPLPCVLPTTRAGLHRRTIMRLALACYDAIAWDRNIGVMDPQKRIPRGRIVSREECLRLAPGVSDPEITGGAVWYDGQIYNSERLTLAFLRAAADAGACLANHAQVTGFLQEGRRILGVRAQDALTGRTVEVRGRIVVNTAGPWITRVLGLALQSQPTAHTPLSKTINLVTTRALTNGHAVSVALPYRPGAHGQDTGNRRLYLTPWRGRTIIGSAHLVFRDHPDACRVTPEEIKGLLADVNTAYPGAALTREEISFVHMGLMPFEDRDGRGNPAQLSRRYRIRDHQDDGLEGLISVEGIKYTTARDVAQKVVDRVMQRLRRRPVPSRSAATPVAGGHIASFEEYLATVLRERPHGLDEDILRQLVYAYGSDYTQVLQVAADQVDWLQRVSPASLVIKAQVVYAVREELAQTLQDVVLRRTELGTLGHPGRDALEACAGVMAQELGWSRQQIERELEETERAFARILAQPLQAGAGQR